MEANLRPVFGFGQPAFGFMPRVSFYPMKQKPKTRKVPGFMRSVLAANMEKLMAHHYAESSNRPKALAQDAGVSLSTVQRIMKQETGATLDNLESIAAAFHLSAYQLLLPNLHPDNPGVVNGATKDEERLYASWRKQKVTARTLEGS